MDVEDRRLLRMFRGPSTLVTRVPVVRLNVCDGRRRLLGTADEILALVPTDNESTSYEIFNGPFVPGDS